MFDKEDKKNEAGERKIRYSDEVHDVDTLIDYCFTYFFDQREDNTCDLETVNNEVNYLSTCNIDQADLEMEKIMGLILKKYKVIDHNFYKFIRLFLYSMKYNKSHNQEFTNCESCVSSSTCNKLYLKRLEATKTKPIT